MNQGDATVFLSQLFGSVESVTFEVIDLALTRSRVVDSLGRAPIDPSWEPTFDEWYAAAEVAEELHIMAALTPTQGVKQFTSEGSTFVFDDGAADWSVIAQRLRSRSGAWGTGGWGIVELPSDSVPFHPRSEAWWDWS